MTKTAPSRIIIKGDPFYEEYPLKASVDIMPGMLIEYDGADVKPHATAGGNASPLFAVENALIGDGIDVAYTEDGEAVLFAKCRPGDRVYALLKTGNNVAINDFLGSGGAGNLQKHTNASQAVNEGGSATYTIAQVPEGIVARALEAVNNSSGVDARILVEVV